MAQSRTRPNQTIEAPPPPPDPESEQTAAEEPDSEPELTDPPAEPRKRAPAGSLQPFFEQIAAYSNSDWETLVCYVYRTQPLTDKLVGGNQHKYITKYSSRFDVHTIKVEHGSGKYQLRLNQERRDASGSKTIRTYDCEIEDPAYPPNIALGEWIDDARNSKWAWAKTKLEQKAREQQLTADARLAGGAGSPAGFAQAVKDIIQLVRPGDQHAAGDKTVQAVVDAMKQAHGEAFEMFKAQQQSSDPTKLIEIVSKLLKDLMPAAAPATDKKDDPMMSHLLDELKEMRKENRELQKELREANKAPDQLSQLTTLGETFGKLEGIFGAKKDRGLSWREVGMKSVELLTERLVPVLPALLAGRGGPPPPTRPYAPPGGIPPGTPPGGAPAPPSPGVAALPEPQPGAPPPNQEETDKMNQFLYYRQMVYQLLGPLVKHLNSEWSGLDFGDWFITGYGLQDLENLKAAGRDQIMLLLKSEKEVWQQLSPFETVLPGFIDEFLAWTPQQPADDDEPLIDPLQLDLDNLPATAATIDMPPATAPAAPVAPKRSKTAAAKVITQ